MNRFIFMTAVLLTATLWATAQSTTAQKFKATYKNTNPTNEMRIFAYIADPDSSGTNIRRIPGGEVIQTIRFEEEDFKAYGVEVLESWNGWFRIAPQIEELTAEEEMIVLDGKEAWIHGSLLANDTRNYGENAQLTFYTRPDTNSPVAFTIEQEEQVTFVDVRVGWSKVKYVSPEGKAFVGWVQNEWLCWNPLTTCP